MISHVAQRLVAIPRPTYLVGDLDWQMIPSISLVMVVAKDSVQLKKNEDRHQDDGRVDPLLPERLLGRLDVLDTIMRHGLDRKS